MRPGADDDLLITLTACRGGDAADDFGVKGVLNIRQENQDQVALGFDGIFIAERVHCLNNLVVGCFLYAGFVADCARNGRNGYARGIGNVLQRGLLLHLRHVCSFFQSLPNILSCMRENVNEHKSETGRTVYVKNDKPKNI
ncbi:hypothetical protein SDC9_100212 [bioreactor metagenome]|uniref:Uncharacterized protein n=1 Tax=bioreactor metagenome TaxID=1076179 RepID=A0A645AV63_9ZZZZ